MNGQNVKSQLALKIRELHNFHQPKRRMIEHNIKYMGYKHINEKQWMVVQGINGRVIKQMKHNITHNKCMNQLPQQTQQRYSATFCI